MIPLHQFMMNLKKNWMEKTIYTRAKETLTYRVFEVPPIIAPMLAGCLVNTEMKKKSVYLKNKKEGKKTLLEKRRKTHNPP